jgi:hypothetical protein
LTFALWGVGFIIVIETMIIVIAQIRDPMIEEGQQDQGVLEILLVPMGMGNTWIMRGAILSGDVVEMMKASAKFTLLYWRIAAMNVEIHDGAVRYYAQPATKDNLDTFVRDTIVTEIGQYTRAAQTTPNFPKCKPGNHRIIEASKVRKIPNDSKFFTF